MSATAKSERIAKSEVTSHSSKTSAADWLTSSETETTKWNLQNLNCKQIILGISHDAGYAPFLDEIVQNDNIRRRITVLEGYPIVKDLVNVGLNIINMNDTIFRPDKLVDRTVLSPSPTMSSPPSAPVTPAAAASTSYATITGNASPPRQLILPFNPKPAPTARKNSSVGKPPAGTFLTTAADPAWKVGPRGLDEQLQVSQAALDGIKKRSNESKKKLCNNHYLRGPCAKGDDCDYEHDHKPTKEELVAIAFMARLNPCERGQLCEIENCIYGHHVSQFYSYDDMSSRLTMCSSKCPSVQNGHCLHPYCKFRPDKHPPGTKVKTRSQQGAQEN
jgi:hypothetical protein